MQAIGKVQGKQLKCIPNNMEKYISFSLGCMDFIDSFLFMSSSLDRLMENLAKEKTSEIYPYDRLFWKRENRPASEKKKVYPYEYLDSEYKFTEKQLPPKETFYVSLSGEDISGEDYAHAQSVSKDFNIQNLGQYHDLYILTDVLSLADVLENFREICINYYGLDAAHCYTSPGLAW